MADNIPSPEQNTPEVVPEAFKFPEVDIEKHRSFDLNYDRPLTREQAIIEYALERSEENSDTLTDELKEKRPKNMLLAAEVAEEDYAARAHEEGLMPHVDLKDPGTLWTIQVAEMNLADTLFMNGGVENVEGFAKSLHPKVAETMEKNKYERDELARLAHTDSRSGLPNVHAFEAATDLVDTHDDGVENREARDGRDIIALDINGFKKLNDTYGHALGHKILEEVGSHLIGTIKDIMIPEGEEDYEYDVSNAFRTGGDEFSILSAPAETEIIEERIVRDFGKGKEGVVTTSKQGETLVLNMSNGSVKLDNGQEVGYIQYSGKFGDVRISLSAGHGENTEDADFAMYEMKQLVKRKEEELANN